MSAGLLSYPVSPFEILVRLLLALVLGSIIGLERESIGRPAGLRTHTLVCMGASLFTLLSVHLEWVNGEFRGEPGRIAAQIVSGIGFLGAGTILRQRSGVRGLTTAASLWAVAGVGMAAGAGYYFGAVAAAALIYFSLTFLRRAEHKLTAPAEERLLFLECAAQEHVSRSLEVLKRAGVEIRDSSAGISGGRPFLRLTVRLPVKFDYPALAEKLLGEGALTYRWEELS